MSFVSDLLQLVTRHQGRLWIILILLVTSFFSAKAVNRLIAYHYLPLEIPREEAQHLGRGSPIHRANVDLNRILQRNLFDSSAHEGRARATPEPEVDEGEIRPSTLSAELLGSVTFSNPRYSVALIRNRSENTTRYYSIGDRILGAQLVRIERFRVIIRNAGRLESLELQAARINIESQRPQTQVSVSPTPTRRPAPAEDVSFDEIAPGRFLIPQDTVDSLLSDLPSILRDARAIPNVGPENQIEGFRLLEIRPNSIYDRLGLQNGDIVMRVNNDDLNSVEKGMSLFTALRNEKSISIDIVRAGSRLNYTYEIR
ncbi:MAG: hypothetical protein EA369_02655 [Bradymonadales bacterium]|nr:MAG: hypothetical protein EA369_02655 [Bradymonadales bacterium]